MHELSIAENITEIVLDSLKESGADQVSMITLEIGQLSGIEVDALQFALNVTLHGTAAEKAEIIYLHTEGVGKCETCGKESPMEEFFSPCALCGSHQMEVIAGKEMRIVKLEVSKQ